MPLYNRGMHEINTGAMIWTSSDVRALLVDSSYSFNADHNTVADVVANEITGASGYARVALTSKTDTEDDTNDRDVLDAADTAFGALGTGATIGGVVLYRHVSGTDSANILIGFVDLTNTPTNGSTFTIAWNASGIFYSDSP